MTVVSNVVRTPDGVPAPGASVIVSLYAGKTLPAFLEDGTTEGVAKATTDDGGTWSLDLRPNADFLPDGTYYVVTEALPSGSRSTYKIIVPADVVGPLSVRDILAVSPVAPSDLVPINSGPPGPKGDPGDPGESAYQIAVDAGFVGTESQWLASLVGAPGSPGAPGADGTDGTDGTNGTNGTDGASAYEIAIGLGFSGTQAQWLASLVGAQGIQGAQGVQGIQGVPGTDGTDGASAYEVAVAAGFSGTQAQWLTSLIGATGATGATGPKGDTGDPGTLTTLDIEDPSTFTFTRSSLNPSGTNLWENRVGGQLTGYGNEGGELRSRAATATRVAFRCQSYSAGDGTTVRIFEACKSDNTAMFWVQANGDCGTNRDLSVGRNLAVTGTATVGGSNVLKASDYSAYVDVTTGTNVAHGTPHLQVRTEPAGITRLEGQLTFSGAISAGATLATIPLGYRPVAPKVLTLRFSGPSASSTFWNLNTDGTITSTTAMASGNAVNFDMGITFRNA
jgi:hypothetical protein